MLPKYKERIKRLKGSRFKKVLAWLLRKADTHKSIIPCGHITCKVEMLRGMWATGRAVCAAAWWALACSLTHSLTHPRMFIHWARILCTWTNYLENDSATSLITDLIRGPRCNQKGPRCHQIDFLKVSVIEIIAEGAQGSLHNTPSERVVKRRHPLLKSFSVSHLISMGAYARTPDR